MCRAKAPVDQIIFYGTNIIQVALHGVHTSLLKLQTTKIIFFPDFPAPLIRKEEPLNVDTYLQE